MPFSRPTLTTLRGQAMQDITSGLPNANGFFQRSVLQVLAWGQAGMAYLHYGFLDWIGKESVPFTCDGEFLEGWAGLKGVTREAPSYASGTWSGTGTNGKPLSIGSLIQRGDGFTYATTANATVSGGIITVAITAQTAGSAGNCSSGTVLTLSAVADGINSAGSASTAVTGGADQEIDSHLRTRMLQVYAAPPQGGAGTDYIEWALAVPGVTRAWCNPLVSGAGTVTVYTMFDVTEAGSGGFPQGTNGTATGETRDVNATGDQLAVANYIYPRQPVTALVYSVAPVAQPQNFTISGLASISTGQKAQVSNALVGLFLQKDSPLGTTSIEQSDVDAAISAVGGLPSFAVTLPSSWPITSSVGSLFTLGTVTYV